MDYETILTEDKDGIATVTAGAGASASASAEQPAGGRG